MRTSGDFHKDLERDLKNPEFKRDFEAMKTEIYLSEMIKRILQQCKISIRKLAKRMGTSKSQVERMINEPAANLGVDTLIRFAIAVNKKLKILIK